MSETRYGPRTPADIRRRGFELLRRCWTTLLIAALLTSVLDWVGTALELHGAQQARQASDAVLAAFYAENPAPEDPEAYAEWAYFKEYFAKRDAEDAAEAIEARWALVIGTLSIVNVLLSAVVNLGLYRGLLGAVRGSECRPAALLSGMKHKGRAMGLSLALMLRTFGWTLLCLIPGVVLAFIGSTVGLIFGVIVMLVLLLWITLRYSLAEIHLADDPDCRSTTSDCLRNSIEDVRYFSIPGMLLLLWPMLLTGLIMAIPAIAAGFVPGLTALSVGCDVIWTLIAGCVYPVLLVCMYDEIRQSHSAQAAQEHSDGALRARALAAGEDPQ